MIAEVEAEDERDEEKDEEYPIIEKADVVEGKILDVTGC